MWRKIEENKQKHFSSYIHVSEKPSLLIEISEINTFFEDIKVQKHILHSFLETFCNRFYNTFISFLDSE